jgi:hypothetical protein
VKHTINRLIKFSSPVQEVLEDEAYNGSAMFTSAALIKFPRETKNACPPVRRMV